MPRSYQQMLFVLLVFSVFIQGCGVREGGLAPVEESTWRDASASVARHVVARGETLYAIAFRYDQDYHRLADLNGLKSPYALRVGQVIKLKSSSPVDNFAENVVKALPRPPKLSLVSDSPRWRWPAVGRIMTTFAPRKGRKGIDIAGKKGSNIRASAAGVVAYAGDGLPGYGNLIILKHDKQYLTAY